MLAKLVDRQRFGEDVASVVVCANVFHTEVTLSS